MTQTIIHLPQNYGSMITALKRADQISGNISHVFAPSNEFTEQPDYSTSHLNWKTPRIWPLILKARKADILIFNGGSSLLDPPFRNYFLLDLPLYRRSSKKAVIYQGSNSRTSYPEAVAESRAYELALGATLPENTSNGLIPLAEIDRKLERVDKFSSYVDRHFFVNPDLAYNLPKSARFMPYPIWPTSSSARPSKVYNKTTPLRVLHTSTNRVLKGTGLIEKALKEANTIANIEIKVLVRAERQKVIDAINWADILVDQMCLGWYGAQAIEALSQGKPVLCNFEQEAFDKFYPNFANKPSGLINVSHEKLATTIAEISEMPIEYLELAKAGIKFANDIHNPLKVVRNSYGDWF